MSWTETVTCHGCRSARWLVVDGVWTCDSCAKQMTVAEIPNSTESSA